VDDGGSKSAENCHDALVSLSTDPRARGVEVPGSPPATRRRAGFWTDPRLAVGVALVAVSALLGATLLGGADATVGVWAARVALSDGQALSAEDLVCREVRFADQADADRYVSADKALPSGTVLARDVGPGELVPRAALGTAEGADPVVEVPLSVPTDAVPATLRPGSVVDVWVTPDPALAADAADGEGADASLVLGRVRVLSVSRAGGALGPSATRQVIVGVEPDQEDALPAALAQLARGSVVLVRRP
jgi:hypothetical protein